MPLPIPAVPLLLSVLIPSASAQPARVKAAATLNGDLGPGVPALERRGVLVTTGDRKPFRVLDAAWEPFERSAAAAKRLSEFLALYEAARKGGDGAASDDDFADLRALPLGGLITPELRSALAAAADRAAAIKALGAPAAKLAKAGSAFDASWARPLGERTPAAFFSAFFSGPSPDKAASRHLAGWAEAAGAEGLDAALEASRAGGAPTPELKALLSRYLADQAAVEALAAADERLRRIERDGSARKAFDDLRAAAPRLADAADAPARLKELMAAEDPPAEVKLTAPELHVRALDSGSLEPGDKVQLTIAYWVDGLAAGKRTEVAEAVYLDLGSEGFRPVSQDAKSRPAGGPYVVTAEAVVPASGRLTYRLVLDSPDAAPLSREASVAVSDAMDGLRADAAKAEGLARACRFEASTAAWRSVLDALGADKKPARARLAAESKNGLRAAESWAGQLAELRSSLDGARLHASPETCDYRTDRAERAMKLLSGLPAGCDRAADGSAVAAELSELTRITSSRRRLQEAFKAATERARGLEKDCRHDDAARQFASALALLDGDPAARCGAYEAEYAAIKLGDLPRTLAAKGLADAVSDELGKARKRFTAGDPAGALAVLNPLTTSLRRLQDARCWSKLLTEADEMSQGAGVALSPSSPRLPADSAAEAVSEAKKDWERRQSEKNAERGAADSLQAPNAAGEKP